MTTDPRRAIPSVDRLLGSPAFRELLASEPRALVTQALQEIQARVRRGMKNGNDAAVGDDRWFAEQVRRELAEIRKPSLRSVINATGVVLHTNLGRAPLADAARDAMQEAALGATNLEYDLEAGARGSRYVHCASLLKRLTGAEAALVVNNNAAALVLALNTFAANREAVISRGELVEIGGAFRIPDIMQRSGAIMREVGSTNRTHADDYARAITPTTGIMVKVHRSNFRVEGFTAEVGIAELSAIANTHRIPLLHDLGSGLLVPSQTLGLPHEPTPMDVLAEGADIVTLSGDKMLGGPQAGILLGRADLIDAMRKNPLCRALRVDKLTLAALEATLALYLDPSRARREIPVLRMLAMTFEEIHERAESIAARLVEQGIPAQTVIGDSAVGGGALPGAVLPTRLIVLNVKTPAHVIEERLRHGTPPIIARIVNDRLCFDPRTLTRAEESTLIEGIARSVR